MLKIQAKIRKEILFYKSLWRTNPCSLRSHSQTESSAGVSDHIDRSTLFCYIRELSISSICVLSVVRNIGFCCCTAATQWCAVQGVCVRNSFSLFNVCYSLRFALPPPSGIRNHKTAVFVKLHRYSQCRTQTADRYGSQAEHYGMP